MQNSIVDIEKEAFESIEQVQNSDELEQLSIKYLGRKGVLTRFLRNISSLPVAERPSAGKNANILKGKLENAFKSAFSKLEAASDKDFDGIDITLPGRPAQRGSLHPITQVTKDVCDIFCDSGLILQKGLK